MRASRKLSSMRVRFSKALLIAEPTKATSPPMKAERMIALIPSDGDDGKPTIGSGSLQEPRQDGVYQGAGQYACDTDDDHRT